MLKTSSLHFTMKWANETKGADDTKDAKGANETKEVKDATIYWREGV